MWDNKKLELARSGSSSKLTESQTKELIKHLAENTYQKVIDICAYVFATYGVNYSVPGMTDWLHSNKFSYKKPCGTPAKADEEKQKAWIDYYEKNLKQLPHDEPVEFGDGVHPTMDTKVSFGWIRVAERKPIATTASRTRMNLMGSLNLKSMSLTIKNYESLNSDAMGEHFALLRAKYPHAPVIRLILDQCRYNISAKTKKLAQDYGIKLHFLPPYSPNLNPIERLWKIMNEHVRNNRYFSTAKDFRKSIVEFFQQTWPSISRSMASRIHDNFNLVKSPFWTLRCIQI